MKLNIQNSSLLITAGLPGQFPRDNLPQIAFSGRSNVGKSSLINSLLGRKKLARVSSSPGKTITINFYDVDHRLYFVDLPGYGYARRSEEEKRRWSALVDGYMTNAATDDRFRLIVQLVDMKSGLTPDDMTMLEWMNQSGLRYIIAATKADKLNKTDRKAACDELGKLEVPVIPFSALTGEGKDEVLSAIIGETL